MTSQDRLFFKIVGGPSKFDLMLSLFDGNKTPRRLVEFQLEEVKRSIPVAITGIDQEDGSGESWCFHGDTRFQTDRNFGVKGYFSTRGRMGWLRFEVPSYGVYNEKTKQYDTRIRHDENHVLEVFVDKLRKQ